MAHHLLEFVKLQWAVIDGARQTEAILDQSLLAGAVAVVHTADLRDGHVAFVDHEQVIARQKVDHRPGVGARCTPVQMARIVLDPRAVSDLFQHLEVITRTLFEALRLQMFALLLEECEAFFQLCFDVADRVLQTIGVCQILFGRVDGHLLRFVEDLSGQRAELHDAFDLIAEERNPIASFVLIRGDDFERIAAHAERARAQFHVVALILRFDQLAQQRVTTI